MFNLLSRRHTRLRLEGESIFIDNSSENIGKPVEITPVFRLSQPAPELKVFENDQLIRLYRIDPLSTNSNLARQFLHSSIRILNNSAVMIDGIISKTAKSYPRSSHESYEAVRLQPFFLSNANEKNIQLIGKGLFERGLHFRGTVTPASVRCVCVCDHCRQSFSLQHFHAGFSEVQYFYSTGSRETLVVPNGTIPNMPSQLQGTIDSAMVKEIDSKLTGSPDGDFRYYNPFKCPYCLTPFIDFEKYPEIRPQEYYGNTLLNHSFKTACF
jgi:hypothetical protein